MSDLQSDSRSSAKEALETLHTRTVDVLAGFEKMAEKAAPQFRQVVTSFRDLHARHAPELGAMVSEHGGTPDVDGSIMSTVNRTVVAVRAMFDEIDEDVMDQVRNGERYVLEAFDDAISADSHATHMARLSAMRAELTDLLRSTDHLD